ncbi:Chemotaxis protein CheY [Candidatus Magnetomoraceae bacterium gMMP-15]
MSKQVLIVDDSSIMRKMARKTLESGNHVVAGEAKNGKEAIELYKILNPEVVTMDVTMREMDGFTAAREIMAYDSNAKIIFLSNLNEEKYSKEAEEIGAKGYINKHKSKEILSIIESL